MKPVILFPHLSGCWPTTRCAAALPGRGTDSFSASPGSVLMSCLKLLYDYETCYI